MGNFRILSYRGTIYSTIFLAICSGEIPTDHHVLTWNGHSWANFPIWNLSHWKWMEMGYIPIHFQTQPRLGRFEVFHRRPSHCLASCLKLFSSQLLWLHDQISPKVQVAVVSMSQLLCKLPKRLAILMLRGIHGRGLHPSLGKIDFVVESLELQMRRDPATRMHLATSQSASCKAVEQLYHISFT